jgi:hypothetical protein
VGLFRRKQPDTPVGEDHAVIVHFALSDDEFGTEAERATLGDLGDRLADVVARAGVGEFDGDEFGNGEAVLYLYGPDSEQLWGAVEPELRAGAVRPTYALLRPGGPDVPAQRVDF